MADGGEARGYEGDVGVGAFGCGGAYLLVRAACAAVCCSGLLRFGARAVFCSFCVSGCFWERCALLGLVG